MPESPGPLPPVLTVPARRRGGGARQAPNAGPASPSPSPRVTCALRARGPDIRGRLAGRQPGGTRVSRPAACSLCHAGLRHERDLPGNQRSWRPVAAYVRVTVWRARSRSWTPTSSMRSRPLTPTLMSCAIRIGGTGRPWHGVPQI